MPTANNAACMRVAVCNKHSDAVCVCHTNCPHDWCGVNLSPRCNDLVAQYKQDIAAVEAKIQTARDKHRLLAQRHARARNHKQAQTTLRKADSLEALARFDRLENRIERMEAEADLVDPSSNAPLVEQFEALKGDDELDRELAALKQQRQGG